MRTTVVVGCVVVALISSCGRPSDRDSSDPIDPKPTPSTEPATNLFVGKLKPYREVNRTVNERFMTDDRALRLSDYFQDPPADNDFFSIFSPSLVDLLGGYNGDGLRNDLLNAAPNGVNLLLWYMALDGVAADLAKVCLPDGETASFSLTDMRGDLVDTIKRLCAEADAGQLDDATLTSLWSQVMRNNAPATEADSWKAFLTTESMALRGSAGSHEIAHAALMAVLYNPHFLLQK